MSDYSAGFEDALKEVLSIEGGYSDHRADSGGVTQYGITEAVARKHGYDGPMSQMPPKVAKEIYYEGYWEPLRCETIMSRHTPLAWEIFEIGVNAGTERAGRFLQRCLNVLNRNERDYNDIAEDGVIGPKTLDALDAFIRARQGRGGKEVIINMMNALQGSFYVRLAERRQKDEAFVFGWFRQRVTMRDYGGVV